MSGLIAVHLWQSTLVALAGWLLVLSCRRNAASIRFAIWFGVSLKFLVPLAVLQWLGDRIGQSLPQPPHLGGLIDTASAILTPALPQHLQLGDDLLVPLSALAATVWGGGTLLLGWRWFQQYRALEAVLASSWPMPMELPCAVYVTHSDTPLGVFGILHPVILVPERVARALTAEQLAAVLAHELCHVRRSDNLLAAIHRCVTTLFWFHPLVWWIGARLLEEREAACDEAVLDAGHTQHAYAESILNVCRLSVVARHTAVAASAGPLALRIATIMNPQHVVPLDLARGTALLATVSVLWFAPIITGIIGGAQRADADDQPIAFEALTLQPAEPGRQRSARFDPAGRRITLKNVSVRSLIMSAYPWALIRGDAYVIENIRYDIQAHWRSQGAVSERALYRHLLRRVLQGHTNVQLFVDQRCEVACQVGSP